ncbi:MAG TPA: glycogen synthase GlgA [Bacilli bacterium]
MKVLFAASEAVPFVKTGGLADVIGSLPKELIKQGAEVRVIMPKYEDIPDIYKNKMETIHTQTVSLGYRKQYCGLQRLEVDGILFYFIDNEFYFRRRGLYGYGDEAERYAFFGRAVLEVLPFLDFVPEVIHCHDWQTGMIPVLLKTHFAWDQTYQPIKTMFTIHNLKYQGIFDRELLKDVFSLGDDLFSLDGLEHHGNGSCLKGGLVYADLITTVSKTYAREIQTAEYGENLDGVLRKRSGQIHGIINGIDNELYDPMTDSSIYMNYRNSLVKKRENKLGLQREYNLPVRKDVPLIGIVTRLVQQKGLDLIERILDELLLLDVQLIVLGTGERKYEELFKDAAYRYPDKVSAHIWFNDGLARKIYAASDLFLMPSHFEPCGIGQLLALRYRTLPIVRETGGLKDTVQPYNKFTGEGTGFSFTNYNAHEMFFTIKAALELYKNDEVWSAIIKNINKVDYGWNKSAKQYISLYEKMIRL